MSFHIQCLSISSDSYIPSTETLPCSSMCLYRCIHNVQVSSWMLYMFCKCLFWSQPLWLLTNKHHICSHNTAVSDFHKLDHNLRRTHILSFCIIIFSQTYICLVDTVHSLVDLHYTMRSHGPTPSSFICKFNCNLNLSNTGRGVATKLILWS